MITSLPIKTYMETSYFCVFQSAAATSEAEENVMCVCAFIDYDIGAVLRHKCSFHYVMGEKCTTVSHSL